MAEIELEKRGPVLEIGLKINEKNSLTRGALEAFAGAFRGPAREQDVRAILLTSRSPGYFSNGFDPGLFLDQPEEEIEKSCRLVMDTAQALLEVPAPIIAVINGHCMGAGSVFSVFSDYRYMIDKGGRIGFPEINIAVNFPAGPAVVLNQLIGRRHTRDILMNGQALKGPQARGIGLVDAVFPAEDLLPEAEKLAKKLASKSPAAIQEIKQALWADVRPRVSELAERDIQKLVEFFSAANGQEGFRSIAEGRRPRFDF